MIMNHLSKGKIKTLQQWKRRITAVLLAISVTYNILSIRPLVPNVSSLLFLEDPTAQEAHHLRQNFQNQSPYTKINATFSTTQVSSFSNSVIGSLNITATTIHDVRGQLDPLKLKMKHHQLEFVHIPKTAGSAIEAAAMEQGIAWGYTHFSFALQPNSTERQNSNEAVKFRKKYGSLPWHIPPCLLSPKNQDIVTFNPYVSGKNQVDLFAVVRNPYDRIVSEYRYFKLMVSGQYGGSYQLNKFVQSKLSALEAAIINHTLQVTDSCDLKSYTKEYFLEMGHYIPQYDFVYQTNHSTNQTVQMIQHVIKYENLNEEFEALMKLYNMENVKLSESKEHRTFKNKPGRASITRHNLSAESIQIINRVYNNDFAAFGYVMEDPTVEALVELQTKDGIRMNTGS